MNRVLVSRLLSMIVAAIAPGTLDGASAASLSTDSPARIVRPNDNRHPAGTLADGLLSLRLRASRGTWYPEGPDGPGLSIDALGEDTTPLSVPSPLIRVPEGTRIVVSVENDLDSTLALHGLCSKNGAACAPVAVSPGRSVDLQFDAGRAGTYHYWATSIGAPVPFREMAGAFVVDPPGPRTEDRILVITALHWHGMELESYYDGVHGWSGHNATLAPMIEADASFIVRFTPPRAGTFMYHTHLHDQRQLPFGLYGPMVVVDPGERFDAETDHVLMVARRHLLGVDTDGTGTRDVDAVDEGRSAAACQLACAGARSSDDRRRRNLRLRARRVAGRPPALDRGPKYGWTMGGAGAGRRQVS